MSYWTHRFRLSETKTPPPLIECYESAHIFAVVFKRRFPEFYQHVEKNVILNCTFVPHKDICYGSNWRDPITASKDFVVDIKTMSVRLSDGKG